VCSSDLVRNDAIHARAADTGAVAVQGGRGEHAHAAATADPVTVMDGSGGNSGPAGATAITAAHEPPGTMQPNGTSGARSRTSRCGLIGLQANAAAALAVAVLCRPGE